MTVSRKNFSPAKIGFLLGILGLYFAFWPVSSFSQTAALLPPAVSQFFDNNGNPLSVGTVDTYVAGTNTKKTTWKNSGETVTNTNPIILDAGGKAIIYGEGTYRQVVKDRNGNIIWDAVTTPASGGGGGGGTATTLPVGWVTAYSGITAPTLYQFAYGQEIIRANFPDLFTAVTITQTVGCTNTSTTITGLTDTTQIPIGGVVELSCVTPGTTVVSKTSSTVILSNPSNVSLSASAVFFLYGNGNGSTTFNLPDLRGQVIAGRNNMGSTASSSLTTAYFGTSPDATGAKGGSQSKILISSNLPPYTPVGTMGAVTPAGTIAITDPGHSHGFSNNPLVITSGTPVRGDLSTFQVNTISQTSSATTGITAGFTGTPVTPVFTGTAQGGTSTAFSIVQPTITLNYIIKVLPGPDATIVSGVASIQGMTGTLLCGDGLICNSQTISIGILSNNTQDNIVRLVGTSVLSNSNTVCDGSADDTAGIAAVLIAASGSNVFIPPGFTCRVSGITIPTGTTFEISSEATLKKIGTSATKLITVGGNNVTLLGPGIVDNNNVTTGGSEPILCDTKSDLLIDGLTIKNSHEYGIHLNNCTKFTIRNVRTATNTLYDIAVFSPGVDISDIVITGMYCDRTNLTGTACIQFIPGAGHTVSNLQLLNNIGFSQAGDPDPGNEHSLIVLLPPIVADTFFNVAIIGNVATDFNWPFSISIAYGTISGNSATNAGTIGYCYEIGNSKYLTISGNDCLGNITTGAALILNTTTDSSVIGNTFRNTSSSGAAVGIQGFSDARNVVVGNRVIMAAGTAYSGLDATDFVCADTTIGCSVVGSLSGYSGAEVRLNGVAGTENALTTNATGVPRMSFAHRGVGNTGDWIFSNGTGAANIRAIISATGVLTLGTPLAATGSLVLANSSNSNLTAIQSGAAAVARTYIWPTNFGAAGSVLTDAAGNGTLSWSAVGGTGTVTSIATTGPITGGTITTTGTIACATCVTSAAALTTNQIIIGSGLQTTAALGSLGTTTTLLHGNAAGAPIFGAVVSADMNITTTSCTNQFVTAISAGGVGTCTTDTLASAQHANQGTTTTVLHGNAAGNPAFGAVVNADLATMATNTVKGNATSGTAIPTDLAVGTCSTSASALIWTTNTGFGCNTSITAAAVAVGGITGLGTGVATALGINVGLAGAFVTFNGAGGTPSALTLTNATGLPLSTGVTGTLQAAQEPAHTGDVTNSAGSLALTIAANAVTLAKLATQATNTVLGNATSGTAVPTALVVGTCSTAASALIWTTNSGFSCNTSITAAAVPASGLTGTTLAAGVIASSLTSVGTLTGGTTGTGFTIALGTSTITGILGSANGGTANGFTKFSGPTTSEKTFTLPNASATVLTDNAVVTIAQGGTNNASLGSSNGGIVYSDASKLNILAATATARQMLQSGASTTPAWSTTTWPATTTVNRILWSSATNVISDLATANSSILVTDGSGIPSLSTTLPVFTVSAGRTTFIANAEAFSIYLQYNAATPGFYLGSSSGSDFQLSNSGGTARVTVSAAGITNITNATASTSKTTGSLTNSGGFGNAGAIFTDTLSVITMASDVASTDNTVCVNSAGLTLKGSGTLGICLGTSGRQFKTAFAPMKAGLTELMQIDFLNYRYRSGYGDGGTRLQYGPVAQDVEHVLPDLAGHNAAGDTINYDAGALIFIGLHAIQELKAANDNLQSANDNLELRIRALETKVK